jgi:hypothetical protein
MTRNEHRIARQTLLNAGWVESHSITKEIGTLDYGTCYVKDSQVFYLNIETINNLPTN